ncbi:MAG: type II secretion system minor pseudopilin GspI [Pseudomonadota bacterium]
MTRQPDAGFTLIETLVALAVLSVSAVAILGAVQAHVARIGALETRAAALWAAETYLAERALGLQPAAQASVLGMGFALAATLTPTADPDLSRIDITAADTARSMVYARLTGFLDSPR